MYTISKEFHFSASHSLVGLPPDHPCSRTHGHNYIVKVELTSTKLNGIGFVEDYRALSDIKDIIDNVYDHRHLNDCFKFNPTAENMAKFFYNLFSKSHPMLSAVEVSETPKTNCRYTPDYDC